MGEKVIIVGDGTLMRRFSHLKLVDKGRNEQRKERKQSRKDERKGEVERKE